MLGRVFVYTCISGSQVRAVSDPYRTGCMSIGVQIASANQITASVRLIGIETA